MRGLNHPSLVEGTAEMDLLTLLSLTSFSVTWLLLDLEMTQSRTGESIDGQIPGDTRTNPKPEEQNFLFPCNWHLIDSGKQGRKFRLEVMSCLLPISGHLDHTPEKPDRKISDEGEFDSSECKIWIIHLTRTRFNSQTLALRYLSLHT